MAKLKNKFSEIIKKVIETAKELGIPSDLVDPLTQACEISNFELRRPEVAPNVFDGPKASTVRNELLWWFSQQDLLDSLQIGLKSRFASVYFPGIVEYSREDGENKFLQVYVAENLSGADFGGSSLRIFPPILTPDVLEAAFFMFTNLSDSKFIDSGIRHPLTVSGLAQGLQRIVISSLHGGKDDRMYLYILKQPEDRNKNDKSIVRRFFEDISNFQKKGILEVKDSDKEAFVIVVDHQSWLDGVVYARAMDSDIYLPPAGSINIPMQVGESEDEEGRIIILQIGCIENELGRLKFDETIVATQRMLEFAANRVWFQKQPSSDLGVKFLANMVNINEIDIRSIINLINLMLVKIDDLGSKGCNKLRKNFTENCKRWLEAIFDITKYTTSIASKRPDLMVIDVDKTVDNAVRKQTERYNYFFVKSSKTINKFLISHVTTLSKNIRIVGIRGVLDAIIGNVVHDEVYQFCKSDWLEEKKDRRLKIYVITTERKIMDTSYIEVSIVNDMSEVASNAVKDFESISNKGFEKNDLDIAVFKDIIEFHTPDVSDKDRFVIRKGVPDHVIKSLESAEEKELSTIRNCEGTCISVLFQKASI